MWRLFSTWICTQHVSVPVTSTSGLIRVADPTSVMRPNIFSSRRTSLYMTVRGAVVTASKSSVAKKTRRNQKTTTTKQKTAALFNVEREATCGKNNKTKRAERVLHEVEDTENDATAIFDGDAMEGSGAIWAEEEGKLREFVTADSEEEPILYCHERRLSQSKMLGSKHEVEDGDREDDGGASGGRSAVEDTVLISEEESRFLKDRFPDLAEEYDTEANQEPLDEVLVDSARVVSWKCIDCEFKWNSGVFVRTCLRTKCPRCEKERNPGLGSRLVQLWDHSLNDPCTDPKAVTASSNKSVYWRCPTCGNSYQARIKDMVAEKAKCPSCSLLNLHANFSKDENGLLQEWHPLKNGDLQPTQVKPTDHTKLWWLCMTCGHEWEASLAARLAKSRRTRGKECPVCYGKGKT